MVVWYGAGEVTVGDVGGEEGSLVSDLKSDGLESEGLGEYAGGGLKWSSASCRFASAGSYSGLATVCVVKSVGVKSIGSTPCSARLSIIFCSSPSISIHIPHNYNKHLPGGRISI